MCFRNWLVASTILLPPCISPIDIVNARLSSINLQDTVRRMSDPNIKQITLVKTQEAGGRKGSKRKTVKKMELPITKEGGGGTSPGTITQIVSSHVPTTPGSPEPIGINSNLTKVGAPVQTAGKASNPVKVVLAAAKKKKVVLAAAKPVVPAPKTRKAKAARKVRMSMTGLSRKIKVAKTIRQKATGDTIDEIKKALVKAALIKTDSKAPEPMLRQMYADYMMLKKRAL